MACFVEPIRLKQLPSGWLVGWLIDTISKKFSNKTSECIKKRKKYLIPTALHMRASAGLRVAARLK
jgi:hypothetical protein